MSHFLPGESFPRAPILPVDREHPPRAKGPPGRSGRKHVAPTPPAAEVLTSFAFPVPRHKGSSAEHAAPCCRGYSRCGIARRGKRPVA